MNAVAIAAFCVVATNPVELTVAESADVIEANSFYDASGDHTFDQVIFWDWDWNYECDRVRDWRLIKCSNGYAQWPERDWRRGAWTCTWIDRDHCVRRVVAKDYRRTWTQTGYAGDPELNDRVAFPECHRRKLRPARYDKPSGPQTP